MQKWFVSLFVVALTVTFLQAGPKDSKNLPAFNKMKSLEGVWEGTTPEGKPVRISYKVVSEGSAVMETIDHDSTGAFMVTMYHLDGDRLMMTHYCSAGNQPRMRLVLSTPTALTFEMFDATNLASQNDAHMRKLVITWTDNNHISSDWTMSKDRRDAHHGIFKLERKS